MMKFPSLPKTTAEALMALAAALVCVTLLALTNKLSGETAAQMAVSLIYGALASWNRGTDAQAPSPLDERDDR